MNEWIVTMTSENRIILLREVREILGVGPGDRIIFTLDGDSALITRQQSVVQHTAGMMPSEVSFATAEEMRATAEKAIAEDALHRMNIGP